MTRHGGCTRELRDRAHAVERLLAALGLFTLANDHVPDLREAPHAFDRTTGGEAPGPYLRDSAAEALSAKRKWCLVALRITVGSATSSDRGAARLTRHAGMALGRP